MAPPITTLRIQGFKSLVDVSLQPRQLNLFIGRPNVGKSNILEAMSLLGAGYSKAERFMSEFIRYESPNQLFVDGLALSQIRVDSNLGVARLWPIQHGESIGFAVGSDLFFGFAAEQGPSNASIEKLVEMRGNVVAQITADLQVSVLAGSIDIGNGRLTHLPTTYERSLVRKYDFKKNHTHSLPLLGHLSVPNGDNLFTVIQASKRMRQETAALFEANKQQFVLRMVNQTLETQKNLDGDVYTYPYSSIADTFQRLIFYLAVIDSNEGAVLLLEEPEVHSFPPYTTKLAEDIAADVEAERNQYFITTHSPYLLDILLENVSTEKVAVFVVDYADYQTVVRQVPDDRLGHVLDMGGDVFFNLNRLFLSADDDVA